MNPDDPANPNYTQPATLPVPQQSQLPSYLSFGHYSINTKGYRKIDDELQPRGSIILPQLQQSERKFFEMVACNDIAAVRDFLQENPHFNINCVNFQGVSALHIAVQNVSENMVELLISQPDIEIGDCVLHAIRDNQIKILKILLNKLHQTAPGFEFVGVTNSSDFPEYVTPLILAAQCGHFEIIELLIERGHKIVKPHPPDCQCHECRAQYLADDLLHGETLRLNLYRAVSNPSYICHSTYDPILTAFQLSKELMDSAYVVPQLKTAYQELANEISQFAVDLIGCCRSTEEMDLVLKQVDGLYVSPHFLYPRLLLAIDYKQKHFVAHPNSRQMIDTAWHREFREWKYKSILIKALYPFFRLLMIPVIAILCLVMPHHHLVTFYSIPVNKMLSHMAAYFIFLVIIFLESNIDKKEAKRGPPNSGLEPVIIIFVISRIWSSFRLCMIRGPARHFKKLWNWYDLVNYILYLLTFSFWVFAAIDVRDNGQVDLERKYWHHLDYTLIAEGTFAIAVVMSFFRTMNLMRLNYMLGPLQICLGKMSADIARYLTMFALIIIAFTCGTCRLYHYYEGMVQIDKETGVKKSQEDSFVSFAAALKTYFWAIFCMSGLSSGDVIIETLPGEQENTYIYNTHEFTEAVGYIAFALFEVIIVIVLLNMLIATMSNTYQRVIDNVDIEYAFGKTEFYMEYMAQTCLPPPLNLIPTARGLGSIFEWLHVLTKTPPQKKARFTLTNCCFIETEMDEQLTKDFPILMTQLIQRYFREKDVSSDKISTDVDVVKQDLNEIRSILRESLQPVIVVDLAGDDENPPGQGIPDRMP
ncbi:short transient receptor potential channel 4-like [Onthophagus taurus]|uniref:short transient receptor potential channel 4-like n=1 Tax=Onthophagus taurus TaxID=166361 RepID=UPI000C2046D0|nr:short transient receptor potential channel 4-like [Onthophagus taurus]